MIDAWLYIDQIHHPSDGNLNKPPEFDLKRYLHRQVVIEYGLKKSVVFYGEYDEASDRYSIPLCVVNWETIFDGLTPKKQIKTTSWAINGKSELVDTRHLKIEQPKVFLQKMRSRIIEELIDLADKFNLADKLKALYEQYSTEIYVYKEGGSPKLRQAIADSNEVWLNSPSTDGRTVRHVIVDYLSIGAVEND